MGKDSAKTGEGCLSVILMHMAASRLTHSISEKLCATLWRLGAAVALILPASAVPANYEKEILPILQTHCFDCHADGAKKGNVSFDTFASTEALFKEEKLWVQVLKNVEGGLMPPAKKSRLSAAEMERLQSWIKHGPLALDPQNPDPGRVTLRRLNRIEYRNTIRDLMGIDFRTDEEFPADDTGYGFDNIGDVLTTSPLLLEKYMQAAETIVQRAVPVVSRVIPERTLGADRFRGSAERRKLGSAMVLSFYDPEDVTSEIEITNPGTYAITLNTTVNGSFAYDPGRTKVTWSFADKVYWDEELKWHDEKDVGQKIELKLQPGKYATRLITKPLVGRDQKPAENPGEGPPWIDLRLHGMTITGPLEKEFAAHPPNYARFYTRDDVPTDPAEQRVYAAEILRKFVTRAYRRPVDDGTIQRLVQIAEQETKLSGGKFELGITRAMTGVLASPRFLFRMEDTLPATAPEQHPLLDEYALASRLSYFLWSTMPDEPLLELAAKGNLRANLKAQVQRMLEDRRADELVRNFAGQWLQTRDVESVSIDARIVQARDAGTEREMRERFEKFRSLNQQIDLAEKAHDTEKVAALRAEQAEMRAKFRFRRVEFSGGLRSAMRREAEMLFKHLLKEDRSVLELVDSRQTFLNEELANHYGIPNVQGGDMRLVTLPPDSPRGGVITMGTVLAVTSNPTRTSPVKRGLFILENILGTPPPPPPPDVPSLEASEKTADGRELSLREVLAKHREMPLCSSCHDRMDPLGLVLENFNAMGLWRDQERGEAIPPSGGKLVTGETFANVQELKKLFVTARRTDYYRCLSEKLLTYALGRGPQPCDILAIDGIVSALEQSNGKFSTLIMGVIESTPFQKRRRNP
jgi:hypothetical protein